MNDLKHSTREPSKIKRDEEERKKAQSFEEFTGIEVRDNLAPDTKVTTTEFEGLYMGVHRCTKASETSRKSVLRGKLSKHSVQSETLHQNQARFFEKVSK
jgi:hypothetical protein